MLSEVDELIGSVIRPVYNMLAYTVVLLAITSLLIFVNQCWQSSLIGSGAV